MIDNNNENENITYQDLQNSSNNLQINVVNTEKDEVDKTIQTVEGIINTRDHIHEHSNEEILKNKNNAILCYLPFVVLYFIFNKKYKESNYMLFHSNQGLTVTIIWTISIVISFIINSIFEMGSEVYNSTPVIISFILYLLYCISFFFSLFGIINTYNGKSKELFLIGNIKLLK